MPRRILFEVPEPEDVKMQIDAAVKMMERGVTFKATELRARAKFSDPRPGDEIVGALPPPAAPPRQPGTDRQEPCRGSRPDRRIAGRDA